MQHFYVTGNVSCNGTDAWGFNGGKSGGVRITTDVVDVSVGKVAFFDWGENFYIGELEGYWFPPTIAKKREKKNIWNTAFNCFLA